MVLGAKPDPRRPGLDINPEVTWKETFRPIRLSKTKKSWKHGTYVMLFNELSPCFSCIFFGNQVNNCSHDHRALFCIVFVCFPEAELPLRMALWYLCHVARPFTDYNPERDANSKVFPLQIKHSMRWEHETCLTECNQKRSAEETEQLGEEEEEEEEAKYRPNPHSMYKTQDLNTLAIC